MTTERQAYLAHAYASAHGTHTPWALRLSSAKT